METSPKGRTRPEIHKRLHKIKVVAFDCDGVMFDSADANTAYYNTVLQYFGRPGMNAEQSAYTQMHTADVSMAFLFGDDGDLEKAQAFRKKMTYMPFIELMRMEPHLKSVLGKLRSKYNTAVASNRTDTMNRVLEIHGLEGDFDLVVSAMDVARPKPHPDELLKVADHFGVGPDEVVYLGDSLVDEQAAKAAGTPLIAYRSPDLDADFHIRSFRELENVLLGK